MKKYKIIGVPLKYGCEIEGADKGIEVIAKHINFDYIIDIPDFEEPDCKTHNIQKVTKVCTDLANTVDKVIKEGFIPITIGGDHSLAIGSIAGSSNNHELNLLWIDTHPDINTDETTISGRIHGLPVACSIGLGPDELVNINHKGNKIDKSDVLLFGINDIDDLELEIIKDNNVDNVTYKQIRGSNLDNYLNYLTEKLKNKKVHVSFDLDCMHPDLFTAVNVPNRFDNGFTVDEAYQILETVLKLDIASIDVVEYNPYNDHNNYCLNILLNIINKITENL